MKVHSSKPPSAVGLLVETLELMTPAFFCCSGVIFSSTSPVDNRVHRYFPDFIIKVKESIFAFSSATI